MQFVVTWANDPGRKMVPLRFARSHFRKNNNKQIVADFCICDALSLQASRKALSAKEAEKQNTAEKVAAVEARVVAAERGTAKLQDEIDRLRKALEQSMTRIHRMSSDSDQYVDR